VEVKVVGGATTVGTDCELGAEIGGDMARLLNFA